MFSLNRFPIFTLKTGRKPVNRHTIDNVYKRTAIYFYGKSKCCVISRVGFFRLTASCSRGKVLIGSTYGFRELLPKLCFLALLFLLSSNTLRELTYSSHALSDIPVSITTMLLACSPLVASPCPACFDFPHSAFTRACDRPRLHYGGPCGPVISDIPSLLSPCITRQGRD